eukprot:1558112-Pyramimonas_sp.AAC.1
MAFLSVCLAAFLSVFSFVLLTGGGGRAVVVGGDVEGDVVVIDQVPDAVARARHCSKPEQVDVGGRSVRGGQQPVLRVGEHLQEPMAVCQQGIYVEYSMEYSKRLSLIHI